MAANPHSTAQVAGHPIHPMVIAFPIGCFVLTLVSDLAFYGTSNEFWAMAAFWLLVIGLITAVLAAVTGLIDAFGDSRVRKLSDARLHAAGNAIALLIALYNWYERYERGSSAVGTDRRGPFGRCRACSAIYRLEGRRNGFPPRVGVADPRDERD
jgi:uncharacterized membrane protein